MLKALIVLGAVIVGIVLAFGFVIFMALFLGLSDED
jgi:hypothetical protein